MGQLADQRENRGPIEGARCSAAIVPIVLGGPGHGDTSIADEHESHLGTVCMSTALDFQELRQRAAGLIEHRGDVLDPAEGSRLEQRAHALLCVDSRHQERRDSHPLRGQQLPLDRGPVVGCRGAEGQQNEGTVSRDNLGDVDGLASDWRGLRRIGRHAVDQDHGVGWEVDEIGGRWAGARASGIGGGGRENQGRHDEENSGQGKCA